MWGASGALAPQKPSQFSAVEPLANVRLGSLIVQVESAMPPNKARTIRTRPWSFAIPRRINGGTTGIVTVQVVEGAIERIDIEGLERLQEGYVRSRIDLAADPPLNTDRLEHASYLAFSALREDQLHHAPVLGRRHDARR